jgi:voltage-gated sodium channel
VIAWLRTILEDPRTERVVTFLILLNALILGLETDATIVSRFGEVLDGLDHIILGLFVIEIAARIAVYRLAFFRDPWSIFDFFVVGIALVPATETFSVLRALRVLRVLRLLTVVPSLRRVVSGLLLALPGMGSIVLLTGVLYYVFAVMATKMYGPDFPALFGTLPASLFTLFTIMTLEGWVDGVVKPIMEIYPYSWVFFITYIIICTFMVLNLFIGVVVNAMQEVHEETVAAERQAEQEMIEQETEPLLREVQQLRGEIASLREQILTRQGSG